MVPVSKQLSRSSRFRLVALCMFVALVAVPGGADWAGRYCDWAVGHQVSAGIFNDHFWLNSLLTLLPLGVLLGIVSLIHFGLSWPQRSAQPVPVTADSNRTRRH